MYQPRDPDPEERRRGSVPDAVEQPEGQAAGVAEPQIDLLYRSQDKSGPRDMGLYSLQWVLIGFYGAVWGIAIVGIGLGLGCGVLANYMGRVVLMIGLTTLAQAWLGHRMAMLSGPNIIPSLAIVAAFSTGGLGYALQSFNALIIGGAIVGVIALLGWMR